MKDKLWTKKYLFSLLLVFSINMGYALLNSVMAIYGTVLASSSVIGGYMITVFTLAALFVRLFIKKLNEKYSNKTLLLIGVLLTMIASLGYCLTKNLFIFLIFRAIHGFGFGFSLTCAVAISNEYAPASRLSESVGFTSSANTLANAIGPSLALEILGKDYSNFISLFIFMFVISILAVIFSSFVKSNTKTKFNNSKSNYSGAFIITFVFFIATFSQGAINSFLTSYAKELGLGNIGLFFTLSAIVTFLSRFFSKKIQDFVGLKKLSFILSLIMALATLAISLVQTKIQLLVLAIPCGLASGLLFPIFNYRIIKAVGTDQIAFGTSLYYCGVDIGYGIGAMAWGTLAQFTNYYLVYIFAGGLIAIMAILDQFIYHRIHI